MGDGTEGRGAGAVLAAGRGAMGRAKGGGPVGVDDGASGGPDIGVESRKVMKAESGSYEG